MSDDQDLDWLQDDKENNPIAEKKGRGKNQPFTTTERFENSKALYEEFTPEKDLKTDSLVKRKNIYMNRESIY